MQENSGNFSMQEALRLAKSPAGQQLLAMLQQQGGASFQQAMKNAAAGNYQQAQIELQQLLSTTEMQQLLEHLGE